MDYASSILGLLPGGRRAPRHQPAHSKLEAYLPPDQVERVREAYDFDAEAAPGPEAPVRRALHHAPGRGRRHPRRPAPRCARRSSPRSCTTSSRTRRPRRTSSPQKFGAEVAELVDGVTKLDQIQFKSREEAQAESFRKMLLAMVRDIRVIMVKLADRTHNMRTLGAMPPAKRRAVARETLDIYAPIANRLGIHSIKLELEELGFRALYPQRYRVIERALKRARGNQKQFLGKIADSLRARRSTKPDVNGRRRGAREAPLQHLPEDAPQARCRCREIVDVFGFRIVVDSVDTCYRALGARARPVQADAGPLQGLHRDPARQRLPVAAHHAVRPERHADRSADPHRGHAPRRRVGHRRALAVQGRRRATAMRSSDRAREWLQRLDGHAARAAAPRSSSRASRSTCSPTRSTCSRRKGEILRLPRGATVRRLRLCGAHRRRQPLRRGQGRPAPRAAAHAAAQRPDRRDHHRQGRAAESRLGELRRRPPRRAPRSASTSRA